MDKKSGHGCFFVQETNKLRSGYTNFPRLYVRMRYFQHWSLEGGYSHKGWVTPLRWHQDTRVQTAHTNTKQRLTTRSDKLVALELQYRTKVSMCNAISFQDRPQELAGTTREKGKIPGEERACLASEIPSNEDKNKDKV